MKKSLLATLAVTIIIGIMLTACEEPMATTPAAGTTPVVTTPAATEPTPGQPRYGGTLKYLLNQSVDPNLGWPAETYWIHLYAQNFITMEPLIRYNRDGTIEPMLATSWELASDLLSIKFDLRKGVKFHDGSEFKADAVKLMVDANVEAGTGISENWKSADIIDDYTVRLNLKKFDNSLYNNLCAQQSMIVSPTAYREHDVEWMRKNPVGTGPFKFVEFKADQYVKFVRNDDYWQEGKPYVNALEVVTVGDQNTLEMAFMGGDGHICALQPAKTMSEMKARGYDVYAPLIGATVLIPDNKPDSPFADKRVREAIEYALNKEAIVDAIGYGIYKPIYQATVPEHPAYNPTIRREYDPDKARQLLAEAGYEDGFDTVLILPPRSQTDTVIYHRFLEEVGIRAKIEIQESLAWSETCAAGWSGIVVAPSSSLGHVNFVSGFNSEFPPYGKLKMGTIVPEGLEELIYAAITEPDTKKAIELNNQVLQVIAEEAIVIPTFSDSLGYVVSTKVRDGGWFEGTDLNAWRPDNAWLDE